MLKMNSTQVSFIPLQSVPNVTPPIIAGQRTSTWVMTLTNNWKDIKAAARNKMEKCYGILIDDLK